MKIGGEYSSDKVTPKNFEQLAEEAGLAKPMVRNRVPELAETVVANLDKAGTDQPVAECSGSTDPQTLRNGTEWLPELMFRDQPCNLTGDDDGYHDPIVEEFFCDELLINQLGVEGAPMRQQVAWRELFSSHGINHAECGQVFADRLVPIRDALVDQRTKRRHGKRIS